MLCEGNRQDTRCDFLKTDKNGNEKGKSSTVNASMLGYQAINMFEFLNDKIR